MTMTTKNTHPSHGAVKLVKVRAKPILTNPDEPDKSKRRYRSFVVAGRVVAAGDVVELGAQDAADLVTVGKAEYA